MFIVNRNLWIRFTVVAMAFFAVGVAKANESFSNASQSLNTSAECGKSTLTGDRFMNMFHAIAIHGDLRDIAFIEATLKIRLNSEYAKGYGEPSPLRMMYRGKHLFDTPINIRLEINNDKNSSLNGAALMFFEGSFSCLKISTGQFNKAFDGGFARSVSSDTSSKFYTNVGKNKVTIRVDYSSLDLSASSLVTKAYIWQFKSKQSN